MAYPNGYRPVTWGDVKSSSVISHIFILEDGRDKPYGPYKVVNASTREVEDESAVYDKRFFVGINEVIGVPDPNYQTTLVVGGAFTPPQIAPVASPAPSTATIDPAVVIYDALFDAFVVQLASKSSTIDAKTRMQLEADANNKRATAIQALKKVLKP